jgi:hypothetical protein
MAEMVLTLTKAASITHRDEMNFKMIGNPQNYTWVSFETWFLETPHQT